MYGGGAKWDNDALRSHFMEFYFCTDVIVEDMVIINTSQWTLRPSYSSRLAFRKHHRVQPQRVVTPWRLAGC